MPTDEGSRAGGLTRPDIIDAAAGLVAENGYAGLTMRALAQRCGVPTMRNSDRHFEEGLQLIMRGLGEAVQAS